MKISLGTVEVTDEQRAAIGRANGSVGMASREACREFIVRHGLEAVAKAVEQWADPWGDAA
jgi:hypothetical protein